jgi:hypothetical protein
VSQTEAAEREAAKKHMKERRLKAKKKREAKQQEELALAVMEKQAMEDELEELKLATVATGEEKVNELLERRVLKMKKKYEKKISSMRADLVDAAEVCKLLGLSYPPCPLFVSFLHLPLLG